MKDNLKSEILLCIEEAGAIEKQIPCTKGSRLSDVLLQNRIFIPADCGGRGNCGKCGVLVKKGTLPITPEDEAAFSATQLQDGMRLSCRAILQDDLTIALCNQAQENFAAASLQGGITSVKIHAKYDDSSDAYGIAIDIGTTTLAFSLLNLRNGKITVAHTAVNPQRAFGADVISRIQAANGGKGKQLCEILKKGLRQGIDALLQNDPHRLRQIRHIAIAGNTVMLHLLRGYSCEGFVRYPFSPQTLMLEELTFHELFGEDLPIKVTLLPAISAFVGADITAGLYASGILETSETSLFLDLGTNGEMALWADGQIFVTSAAAGPAFEGGNIKWGCGSIPGAISQVTLQNNAPKIKTIQNAPPIGICGTGVIEAAAELFSAGWMDETGKLKDPYFKEGFPLAKTVSGEQIFFTQNDIRQIQLAKAAIRAGIELLLQSANIHNEQIRHVYLAGGFGAFLNVRKAAEIGIFPPELSEKAVPMGNTSLHGALLYLADPNPALFAEILAKSREISLAKEADFQELYIQFMSFEKIT